MDEKKKPQDDENLEEEFLEEEDEIEFDDKAPKYRDTEEIDTPTKEGDVVTLLPDEEKSGSFPGDFSETGGQEEKGRDDSPEEEEKEEEEAEVEEVLEVEAEPDEPGSEFFEGISEVDGDIVVVEPGFEDSSEDESSEDKDVDTTEYKVPEEEVIDLEYSEEAVEMDFKKDESLPTESLEPAGAGPVDMSFKEPDEEAVEMEFKEEDAVEMEFKGEEPEKADEEEEAVELDFKDDSSDEEVVDLEPKAEEPAGEEEHKVKKASFDDMFKAPQDSEAHEPQPEAPAPEPVKSEDEFVAPPPSWAAPDQYESAEESGGVEVRAGTDGAAFAGAEIEEFKTLPPPPPPPEGYVAPFDRPKPERRIHIPDEGKAKKKSSRLVTALKLFLLLILLLAAAAGYLAVKEPEEFNKYVQFFKNYKANLNKGAEAVGLGPIFETGTTPHTGTAVPTGTAASTGTSTETDVAAGTGTGAQQETGTATGTETSIETSTATSTAKIEPGSKPGYVKYTIGDKTFEVPEEAVESLNGYRALMRQIAKHHVK